MYCCVNCGRTREQHGIGKPAYCSNNSGQFYDEGGTKMDQTEIHHFASGASSSGHKPPYECLTIDFIRRSALRMQSIIGRKEQKINSLFLIV
jgi:hypothetical protein